MDIASAVSRITSSSETTIALPLSTAKQSSTLRTSPPITAARALKPSACWRTCSRRAAGPKRS